MVVAFFESVRAGTLNVDLCAFVIFQMWSYLFGATNRSQPDDLIVIDDLTGTRFYDDCAPIQYPNENITSYVYNALGERCVTTSVAAPTVIIYGIILLLGFVGNLCTCIVIATNKSMQNPTNYYLFNLAVSDLLMLILGLPMELWGIFDVTYPYRFNAFFCKSRAFLIEFTSYASILTITCFSIERWLAICYPLKHKSFSSCHRATMAILGVWLMSFLMASPVLRIVVINKLDLPVGLLADPDWHNPNITRDGATIVGTDFCSMNFKEHLMQRVFILCAFSGFFVFPALVISVLYTHIMSTIQTTDQYLTADSHSSTRNQKILKMLLAVVVMFFICWLPFHLQRLLAIYLNDYEQGASETMTRIYNYIFYCSGYFYYSNSACNPVLYNVMSTRYRRAFKKTILSPFPYCKSGALVKTNSISKNRTSVSRLSNNRFAGSTRAKASEKRPSKYVKAFNEDVPLMP